MTTEMNSLLDSVERTALLTAALRAAETRRPDRLYTDPYAEAFAGDVGPRLLAEIQAVMFPANARRTLPSTPDYNAIRTRFFDDLLTDAARTPHGRQIVIAPSGMDSRPFRLSWPAGVRVYEIDRPRVVALKEAVLTSVGATSTVDRTTVAVDLRDDWEADLFAAGYDPDMPSTWLLEGLLYYVGEDDVHRLMDRVHAVTAPGSVIAADIVNVAALTQANMRGLLDVFAGWGCPWVFGCDQPEALFGRHGFDAVAFQPGDPEADYGRWPDPVPARSVRDVRRVFFVRGVRR